MTARLRVDDQLCFALYTATNAVTRAYRPLLSGLGLTYPQYLVLMVLWQHGEMPVHEIAEHLDLPPHALSPLLRRLEKAGLVDRRRGAPDRRVVTVALTDRGGDLHDEAAEAQAAVVCRTGLEPDDLDALRETLHALVSRIALGPAHELSATVAAEHDDDVTQGEAS